MLFEAIIFYALAVLFVAGAVMVVVSRNAVHSALYLVLTFFVAAAIWLLLEAEFLALILLLVYVGAVMTLFLFVVMMLNLDVAPKRATFVKFLPFGLLVLVCFLAAMIYAIGPRHFGLAQVSAPPHQPADYSNVKALGSVLYTQYVYPFELAAVLLVIAIIASISLALRGPRRKRQEANEQLRADPKQRLEIHNMEVQSHKKLKTGTRERSNNHENK